MELLIYNITLIGSAIAGGLIVATLKKTKSDLIIKLMLAFSGGFLLSIAFIHFIPELYHHASINVGVFILIGFLIQLLLEFFSGGIEHGHIHIHKLAKIPFGLVLALSIHSLLEGIPLGSQLAGHEIATNHHHANDNSLLFGILFHRLPVAIALMTLLLGSGISSAKAWIVLSFFAITTSVGLFFGYFSNNVFADFNFDIILAIVVGMLLHISTTIIFETNENHKVNLVKFLTILFGSGLAFFMH